MEWMNDGFWGMIGVLFGTGGLIYAVIMRILDRKKYKQEVKEAAANADIKTDEFWKGRYDVLNEEMKSKDNWWKERYDNLYQELQNERQLSNDIIKSFRTELNEIREDYERQRELDKDKYNELMEQYNRHREESSRQNKMQMERINQLEKLVNEYEKKLNGKGGKNERPNHD